MLKDGQEITVSCCQGDKGYIYDGLIQFEKKEIAIAEKVIEQNVSEELEWDGASVIDQHLLARDDVKFTLHQVIDDLPR